MAKQKNNEKKVSLLQETADALADYAKVIEIVEWLRDNGEIKSDRPAEDLAYAYAILYTSDSVRDRLSFLRDNPRRAEGRAAK